MRVIKIPAYYYQNNAQKAIAKILVFQDDEIVSRYSSYTTQTRLYTWSDQAIRGGASNIINEYLGFNLLNPQVLLYVGRDNVSGVSPNFLNSWFNVLGQINYSTVPGLTRASYQSTSFAGIDIKTLNNITKSSYLGACFYTDNLSAVLQLYGHNVLGNADCGGNMHAVNLASDNKRLTINLYVFKTNSFKADGSYDSTKGAGVNFNLTFAFSSDDSTITSMAINVQYSATMGTGRIDWLNLNGAQSNTDDLDNPYGEQGPAETGGGDGEQINPNDVDKTEVPSLPDLSAVGMVSIYNPTASQLQDLSDFLWSSAFDLDTYKKLYGDPMQCLIGLSILPCVPTMAGTRHIHFGNIDSEVSSNYCSTQWVQVNCGSVNVKKVAGSFMDYSPYVKIHLVLPFCNIISIDADEVMGDSIGVTYNVDVLSGDCIAFVSTTGKGVIYSVSGNCRCNIPMTGQNFAEYLRSYNQGFMNVIPSMVGGGMSGGAYGAMAGGIGGLMSASVNAVTNCKPTFQHSGGMGGGSAIMGIKKPFIIIERPNVSVPNRVQHYIGQSSNITANLGALSGFTLCEYVHLDNIDATAAELDEIERMLKQGVML